MKKNLGIRVAYQTWKPEQFYDNRFYRTKINWNLYQSAIAKLKRKPIIGKLEALVGESIVTAYALENGAGSYSKKKKFIVIHAIDKKKANKCALELGLPLIIK
ncbi:MAG: hypothetical protein V1815_02050 [Candidatus Woesearchaeota archaeon]